MEFKFTKKIFDFISLEIINIMIKEVKDWVECEELLSNDKIKSNKVEIVHWAQLDCIWICFLLVRKKILLSEQDKDNKLFEKYKEKLKKFCLDQKKLDTIVKTYFS